MKPEEVIEEIKSLRTQRKRRRRLPDVVQVECCQSKSREKKSIWYVMPMKGIRVHSWTDPFWKATRIRFSKA